MKQKILIIIMISVALGSMLFSHLWMNRRFNLLQQSIRDRDTVMRTQDDRDAQTMDQLKQAVLLLTQDSHLFRQYLQLPPQSFPNFEEEKTDQPETPRTNQIFFKALDTLVKQRATEEAMIRFYSFISDSDVSALFKRVGLEKGEQDGLSARWHDSQGRLYFILTAAPDKQGYQVKTPFTSGKEVNSVQELERFVMDHDIEIKTFYERVKGLLDNLNSIQQTGELSDILRAHNLTLGTPKERGDRTERDVVDSQGRILLSFGIDRSEAEWSFKGKRYPNALELSRAVIESLEGLDLRPEEQIQTEQGSLEILRLLDDDGFMAYLKQSGLKLSEIPREDLYYLYYDLSTLQDYRIGSFAVQKNVGEIYLMDKDDVIITSLKTLGIQTGLPVKKKAALPTDLGNLPPLSLGKGDKSFLLIGANEGNTDTIMVVHLDNSGNNGTIVSVPRDLYFKGRKINTIYPLYGPEELKKTISEITGLPIERYMYIDMFAFADVVDLLGGIDIVLKEPLIDPTYVVKNDGRWSTLHYEAGPHHLGGVESLRIARSRHTSDDFGRAERQQMLLIALKEKISGMNAGSFSKVTDLINVLMNYVRTDFSVLELMSIFTHHRDNDIRSYVLSWDNVLYHTYSNLYLLGNDVEVDENFNKGAWIMLPLNNDWNVIRWYIRDILAGERDG